MKRILSLVLFVFLITSSLVDARDTFFDYNEEITPNQIPDYLSLPMDPDMVIIKFEIRTMLREDTYKSGGILGEGSTYKKFYYTTNYDFVVKSRDPLDQYIGKTIKSKGYFYDPLTFTIYQILEVVENLGK